jgi:hypothetical protein
MSELPYTHVPLRLKEFLDRIPSDGIPNKLTLKVLEARGYRSSNDRSILRVLRGLGLTDEGGTPTEAWVQYRDRSTNRALLASLIHMTYKELFETYPDAYNRSDNELQNFMRARTGVSDSTVRLMVNTFKTLCSMADFGEPVLVATSASLGRHVRVARQEAQPQLQLNFHLHLSDTDDADKIDRIFKSMARYLLGRDVAE